MLQAFVITLREGLEAFLIVAISLAYLRKSGRLELAKAVYWGIVVAVGVSAIGGYLLFHAANQEWIEGPLALVAAVSVLTLTVHMWRAGRQIKGDIEGHLKTSAQQAGVAALSGVFLFTLLMIGREGVETALLLIQLHPTPLLAVGAATGVLAAASVAWVWSRFGHKLNLGLFFQTTAIFLFVFVVQLLIQGVHETSEQGYLGTFSAAVHDATEAWGPDSGFGHLLTYLLVILPLAWLLIKGMTSSFKGPKPPSSVPQHSSAR